MFTRAVINAHQALDWGLVNEVLPKDSLMDRAWELAEDLMKIERVTRRLDDSSHTPALEEDIYGLLLASND